MLVMISESLTIFPLTASKKEYRDHLLLLIGLIYCLKIILESQTIFRTLLTLMVQSFIIFILAVTISSQHIQYKTHKQESAELIFLVQKFFCAF